MAISVLYLRQEDRMKIRKVREMVVEAILDRWPSATAIRRGAGTDEYYARLPEGRIFCGYEDELVAETRHSRQEAALHAEG